MLKNAYTMGRTDQRVAWKRNMKTLNGPGLARIETLFFSEHDADEGSRFNYLENPSHLLVVYRMEYFRGCRRLGCRSPV